ncbi:hypothetical protein [Notoacmeibacter ruber]|uniref:Uncharacterized protein n=1 Tax=Notoacmeibacter ruber TaxID=2670375 RepID=A0A3L7JK72_9HYPH|nr:hypothetical protein [Notoacmeibacter ruber]RLQ88882.1 hypothetical protein D8780_12265 [Notoacmeibacter ruber]
MTAGEFIAACASFARCHPSAVLDMPAPELAIDPRASAHHVRSTVLAARQRMKTTAKLALRQQASDPTDLFTHTTEGQLHA